MEARLVIAGANILAASGVALAYSLVTGAEGLLGVSLSVAVLGFIVIAYGMTYGESVVGLMQDYSRTLTELLVKLLEDMNLLDAKPVAVYKDGRVVLVVSRDDISRDDPPPPGVGVWRGKPYVAVSLDKLAQQAIASEAPGDAASEIRRTLSEVYGITGSVIVERHGEVYEVIVDRIHGALRDSLGYPVNPLVLATLAAACRAVAGSARLESMECTGSSCRITLRVSGGHPSE